MIDRMNFFEEFSARKDGKEIIQTIIPILVGVLVVWFSYQTLTLINEVGKANKKKANINQEYEYLINATELSLEKGELEKSLERIDKLYDDYKMLEVSDFSISHKEIFEIGKELPTGMFLNEIVLSEEQAYLIGNAIEKTTISNYQNNLRNTNLYSTVFLKFLVDNEITGGKDFQLFLELGGDRHD